MLIFIAALLIVAAVFEGLSLRDPAGKLRAEVESNALTVEQGEYFTLTCRVKNLSRLPQSRIKVVLRTGNGCTVDPEASSAPGLKVLRPLIKTDPVSIEFSSFIPPRKEAEFRIAMCLEKRGMYAVPSLEVSVSDFLCFTEKYCTFPSSIELVALPKRAEGFKKAEAAGGMMGNISVRRFIMEDPILTLGFREYTGTEPQKMIAWTQSARYGRMMVKKYDYTTELEAFIILNTDFGSEPKDEEAVERCFSLARSVCEQLESSKIKYSFHTNAQTVSSFGLISDVTEGLGGIHLLTILEGLGRAATGCTVPMEQLFFRAGVKSQTSTEHIVISPVGGRELDRCVAALNARTGSRAYVMTADRG